MLEKVRRTVRKLTRATTRKIKRTKDRFELSVETLPGPARELPEPENPLLNHVPVSCGSAHSYRQPRLSLLNPDERPITASSISSSKFDQENNIGYDSDHLDFFPTDPLPKGPLRVCNPDLRPTSSDSALSTPPHHVEDLRTDDGIHPVRFELLVTEPEQDDRSAPELAPQPTLRDSFQTRLIRRLNSSIGNPRHGIPAVLASSQNYSPPPEDALGEEPYLDSPSSSSSSTGVLATHTPPSPLSNPDTEHPKRPRNRHYYAPIVTDFELIPPVRGRGSRYSSHEPRDLRQLYSMPIADYLRLEEQLEEPVIQAERLTPPQTHRPKNLRFPPTYRTVPHTASPHGKLAEDARVAKYAARIDEIRAKLRRRSRAPLPIRRLPIKFKFQPIDLPRVSFPLFPGPPTFAAASGAVVRGAERAVGRTYRLAYRKQQRLKRLRFSTWVRGKGLVRVMRQRLEEALDFGEFELGF